MRIPKCEGYVLMVADTWFMAELAHVGYVVEINTDSVPENERFRIKKGATFTWHDGIKFDQPTLWTREEIEWAKERAEEISKVLDWGNKESNNEEAVCKRRTSAVPLSD